MPRYRAQTVVVDYESASRNGEPFERMVRRRRYLPNIVARFCTAELKVRRIRDYLRDKGMEDGWTQFIGIRGDEPNRAVKIHGRTDEGHDMWCPLYLDGVTKEDIHDFWNAQAFDLQLPNNNGTTDWGNCDLCFLKGGRKKISLIRQRPDLADWWIDIEDSMSDEVGAAALFRADQPNYRAMKIIATSNHELDLGDDPTIPCYCGD